MRAVVRLIGAVAWSLLVASAAYAQGSSSTTFRGVVTAGPDGRPLGGVDVWLLGADQHTQSDSAGAFAFNDLTPGAQVIQLRHVGFVVRRDTVTLGAGETRRRYTLSTQTTTLDTMHTLAGRQRYISPALQAFEERRNSHMGGYFISDSLMRQNENTTLMNLLTAHLPGVTRNQQKALVSTRKSCRGPVLLPTKTCNSRQIPDCYVSIYIDGTMLYQAQMMDLGAKPPDLTQYGTTEFAGAEYYAGGGASPAGMHSNDDGCGTLWLWTREK